MNQNEYTIDDLISEIRQILTNQGPVGRWLLSRIDESLEDGIEDLTNTRTYQAQLNFTTPTVSGKQELMARSPNNGWELFEKYIDVLDAYLVTLPECFTSAVSQLADFGATNAVMVFDNELAPNIPQKSQALFGIDEMFPATWHQNADLVREVRQLIHMIVQK